MKHSEQKRKVELLYDEYKDYFEREFSNKNIAEGLIMVAVGLALENTLNTFIGNDEFVLDDETERAMFNTIYTAMGDDRAMQYRKRTHENEA